MIRLMFNRRSIRKYKRQPVEKEKLSKLLTAALLAPTSRGRNPWSFIVVDEPSELLRLSQAKAHGSAFVKDAPVAVIVVADRDSSDACIEDTSIAISYMQMQAERMDLGSCWVQIRMRQTKDDKDSEGYIRNVFGIPENYLVEAVVTFGYKDEEKAPHQIEDLDLSKLHYHTFGIPYPGKIG